MNKPLEALRIVALTAVGLIMTATPLALWVAWSQAGFVLVLGTGAAAGVLFYVLYADTEGTNEEQREDSSFRTIEDLDEEFLSELSDMGPFIYHHGLSGDARFRTKMARLKKKLVSSNRPRSEHGAPATPRARNTGSTAPGSSNG